MIGQDRKKVGEAYRGMVGSLKVPEKRLSRWGS